MTRLVLASTSPRRKALLQQMGLSFDIVAPEVDERVRAAEAPRAYVLRLAESKAAAGLRQWRHLGQSGDKDGGAAVVLGADTAVVVNDEILGKPCGLRQGKAMLMQLSGRSHQVMTAVAVFDGERLESDVTEVTVVFRPISNAEADAYLRTGEGSDKAGSYGIQGIGGIFAERIEGSYSAVVGLPLAQTETLLRKLDIDTWSMRFDG